MTKKIRKRIRAKLPNIVNSVIGFFYFICFFSFSLIFFRANNVGNAFTIINKIFKFNGPLYLPNPSIMIYSILGILIILFTEFQNNLNFVTFSFSYNKNWIVRNLSYSFLIILILLFGVFDGGQFIYFQF